MLRITWRLQRGGLIAMTAFGIFYGLIQASAYKSAAGTTPAQQAAFGHQMEVLGQSLIYLLPKPVGLDNISGFLQWRVYGVLPLLFGIWVVISGAGASRGDEERGLLDEWVSAGVSPIRYLVARVAGRGAKAPDCGARPVRERVRLAGRRPRRVHRRQGRPHPGIYGETHAIRHDDSAAR